MEMDCETECQCVQNYKRAKETWVAWRQLPSKQTNIRAEGMFKCVKIMSLVI